MRKQPTQKAQQEAGLKNRIHHLYHDSKRLVILLALFSCGAIALLLFACSQTTDGQIDILPVQSQNHSALPSIAPSPTSSPTPLPTPLPTPIRYTIEDFLPVDQQYISYALLPGRQVIQESYIEFTSSELESNQYKVQRRTICSNDEPFVEVLTTDSTTLQRMYRKTGVGYTLSVLDKVENAEILLQMPLESGNRWDIPDGHCVITSTDMPLDIPLGRINAIEVTSTYDNGEKRLAYFARGLGLVAEYHYDANGALLSGREAVLTEQNKDFMQKIRFFYADQQDGTIKYITREVPIKPNTSMSDIFEKQLAVTKSGSYLIPLSPGVNIRSIKLDNKALRVDFSQELVTQMQISRQNEMAFLQALANTFGEYYQAKEVFITVEGEPYASRYIILLKNESFTPKVANAQRFS